MISPLEGFFNRTSAGRFETATFQIAFTAESGDSADGSLWPAVPASSTLPARVLRWVKSARFSR